MPASLTDTRSTELYHRALELLPGGVNSPARAMRAIGRDPIFVERGAGAELVDVDGNRYVDYVCSWGPLIHGHAHPRVLAAVIAAAESGTSFGAPTAGEVDLAAEIARRMESVDMLRMTSSGTEATMTALRLARAATGRERIVKFAGAYHGHVDGLLALAGSGLATHALPSSPGVPASAAANTTIVQWNDADSLLAATGGRSLGASAAGAHEMAGAPGPAAEDIAAILVEPLPANMGVVPARDGFLELLRECADAIGALLIFDEVISGFRVAAGGMQELAGVEPDLTIMGKIIGGGLPAGAVGGSAELMRMLAPAGEVYQAGTLSGNPLAVAAGLATLRMLDDAAYQRLVSFTDELATGLRAAAAEAGGYPIQVSSAPGLLTVFFSEAPVTDLASAQACDLEAYATWCRELLSRGVYAPASQFEAWFPSLVHTPEQLDLTLSAAAAAFAELT
ncbi:MAG TPA: glutamate-1-semialdehyde 2,1-aminomutase [Solirubrobacteraceae bacterium]|nr:glutamate-1-semialdehyde 2,1-aminomutase [Solirubrobacteraceae bacterium]